MEQLETEMDELNTEKSNIEEELNSGITDTSLLTEKSKRLSEIMNLLDEKEMRWLELSEIGN